MKHIIKISIEAESATEAQAVVLDLLSIRDSLSNSDLKELKTLLENNPQIIQTAKKFLGK
jgi:hypothetical protein